MPYKDRVALLSYHRDYYKKNRDRYLALSKDSIERQRARDLVGFRKKRSAQARKRLGSVEARRRRALYMRDWRKRNPNKPLEYARRYAQGPHREKYLQAKRHRHMRERGCSPEQYVENYNKQAGCCLICNRQMRRLRIDHDHKTGMFRGLLCDTCNCGLGMFRDSSELLRKAAEYILADRT